MAAEPATPLPSTSSPAWSSLVWLGAIVAVAGAVETAHLIAIDSPHRLHLAAGIGLMVFGEGQALLSWHMHSR